MIIMSCDPGKTGAVCLYDTTIMKIIDIIDITLDHNLVDYRPLYQKLLQYKVQVALLEDKLILPHDGKNRLYITASNYGIIQRLFYDVCIINGIELIYIRPMKWKKGLGLLKQKKIASLELARLFNQKDSREFFKLKKHHNRAESFLIAKYYEILLNGKKTNTT